MFEGFSGAACRAVVYGQQQARDLEYGSAGVVHLLLGVSTARTAVSQALVSLGAPPPAIRHQIERHGPPAVREGSCKPINEAAEDTLRRARVEATIGRHRRIETGHLTLALLRCPEAADLLTQLGAPPDVVRYVVVPRLGLSED